MIKSSMNVRTGEKIIKKQGTLKVPCFFVASTNLYIANITVYDTFLTLM